MLQNQVTAAAPIRQVVTTYQCNYFPGVCQCLIRLECVSDGRSVWQPELYAGIRAIIYIIYNIYNISNNNNSSNDNTNINGRISNYTIIITILIIIIIQQSIVVVPQQWGPEFLT